MKLQALRGNALRAPLRVGQPKNGRRSLVIRNAFSVRPYTVRRGDTLTSIAEKRGFQINELKKLNHEVDLEHLQEGQTIIVPAGSLSKRDREILSGIGPGTYRTYPVRAGEKVEDIMYKRNISLAEMERLNPGLDLKSVKANQILKLPANKYTVREREMLMGVAGAPQEYFEGGKLFGTGFLVGLAAFAAVSYFLRSMKDDD